MNFRLGVCRDVRLKGKGEVGVKGVGEKVRKWLAVYEERVILIRKELINSVTWRDGYWML
jgi:hypothetical protein